MDADEEGTHAGLAAHREQLIDPSVKRHGGRIVKLTGDGALAEFQSVVHAVQCAIEIQRGMAARNADIPTDEQIIFRIGVNLGDVITDNGDLYGGGVNVAARLESLAAPGGILISGTAFDHVDGRLDCDLEFVNEQRVKNIERPVRVYRVVLDDTEVRRPTRSFKRLGLIGVAAIVLVAAAGSYGVWQSTGGLNSKTNSQEVLDLPAGPAIAVLPFDNLSGDPGQEYFTDGVTEEIISRLAQYKEYLVFARNTMFKYKGEPVNIVEFADELGADYVVEGSVRRQTDSVRITAQLLDADSGGHIWSDSYDRGLTADNILDIQDEIATAIAHRIADSHGEINLRETARAENGRPNSLEGYECLLKFFAYERMVTLETHQAARQCLERTIKRDPESPNSWWPLASLYVDEMLDYPPGVRSEISSFDRAVAAGEEAVKLQPRSARAHAALSRALFFTGESQRARDEAETAIALNPNDAEVLGLAVEALTQTGMFNRGYDLLMKLKKLNPDHPDWMNYFIFFKYFVERDFDQAMFWIDKARSLDGWHWWTAHRAVTYCLMGEFDRGKKLIREVEKSKPNFKDIFWEEMKFFNPHPDSQVRVDLFLKGAAKCNWELPPREAERA